MRPLRLSQTTHIFKRAFGKISDCLRHPTQLLSNNGTTRLFSLRAEAVKEMRQLTSAYPFAVTGAEKAPG